MLRQLLIENKRPVLVLKEITDSDRKDMAAALLALRDSTAHRVGGLIILLEHDFELGVISTEAIERLSRWTNSEGSFARAVDPARNVARILFGKGILLERLVDPKNHQIDDYSAAITELASRINTPT